MPSLYTNQTFAQLKTALAAHLSDVSKVFWVDAELGVYLNQALREFNSIARIFRDRGVFNTVASQQFYDLRTQLKNAAAVAFLNPTVASSDVLTWAKYFLMEGATPSDGFTLSDFNNALTQRQNQFLLETGIYISQPTNQVVNTTSNGRVQITDDSVIDIRRASWLGVDGTLTQLFREDAFTSFNFDPSWAQSPATPQRYSIYPDPLLTLQLIPPPVDIGTLILQTISAGQPPDDFMPAILWGVLADLLGSPGPLYDPDRAAYGEKRWQEGIAAGKNYATALQCYINGVPVQTGPVFYEDTFNPGWQVPGAPANLALLGSNLMATTPVANDIYAVVIDSVCNAPQLVNAGDFVPLGREYVDAIIDYAAHLATFKQCGQEFQATLPAYDDFVKAALAYNNRMYAQNLHFDTMVDVAKRQEQELSLRQEVAA